ncbi:hypothetical protein F7725_022650 [Dissostichus mawsoni]|uniref:Integrase core domain-containing protein n=1 Tax=Dissostichus mawsoni TaxID=36200 RepID=A0A7J5YYJ0_DISMA|nr:hypothetical protein F7725_022650 [Dissostichus mawsoni]
MWLTLKQKHGLHVKRETVMRMLRELNPLGTLSRTRRRFVRRTYHSMGPNYVWHVDGYDKLKPFGIGISGCIDGFSRKIMWLKCGPTNKTQKNVGVIPMRLRTDCGTENGLMASVQCTLRHDHSDYYAGDKSHMFGSYEQPADRVLVVNIQKTKFFRQTWLNVFTFGTGTESGPPDLPLVRVEFLMSCIHYLTGLGHGTVALLWMKHQPTFFKTGIRQKIHVVIRTSMTIFSRQCNNMDFNTRYLASSIPAVDYTEGNIWAVNGTVPSIGQP